MLNYQRVSEYFDPNYLNWSMSKCLTRIFQWLARKESRIGGPVPRDFVHPGAFQHCASAHKSLSDTGQMPKINLQSLDPSNGH